MKIKRMLTYEGDEERVRFTVTRSLADGEHRQSDLVITAETVEGPKIASCQPLKDLERDHYEPTPMDESLIIAVETLRKIVGSDSGPACHMAKAALEEIETRGCVIDNTAEAI